jgi:ubiquinone/menaquinone biosynthesis C-methylase UbiE
MGTTVLQRVVARPLPAEVQETRAHYEQFPFIEGGEKRIAWWADYLADYLPESEVRGALVGDMGCGVGEIARSLANRGARMVCMDLTERAIERCAEINPDARTFQGSVLDLPFADEAFDHTLSIGVLMITPDCRKGFREMARVTRPGGRVVLFIYNKWSYLNAAYKLFKPVREALPLAAVPSFLVRGMQPFVKSHLGMELSEPELRRLLGDKLWTPHATFHSVSEIEGWGKAEGLKLEAWKRFYHGYANVFCFRKAGASGWEPRRVVAVRCIACGAAPLPRERGGYACHECGASYPRRAAGYVAALTPEE